MKSILLFTITGLILLFGSSSLSLASSVSLQWDPNTDTDLAGYKVYYRADSSELPFDGADAVEGAAPIDVKNLTTAIVSGLEPGRTYYFAVTAYNTAGQESSYSNIVAEAVPLSDPTAPVISSFTIPATSTSLTVTIITLSASDNVGVSGYLLTESAANIPSVSNSGWSAAALSSYTFSSAGTKSLYAWAKDAAGNISNAIGRTVTITLPDTSAPVVSAFSIPATYSSLTVPITTFSASDNIGVTGYLTTESSSAPSASATGWSATVPSSYTFAGEGSKTLYAWAKDAAGNVAASRAASVTITLPDMTAPTVSAFTLPSTATNLTVLVSCLTATDIVGVSGYLITESVIAPAANATGWTASAPATFTFSTTGTKTAYAWARDAAGNVSASRSATITIIPPDTTPPTASITSPFTNATVSGTSYVNVSASDNVGVSKVELFVNGAFYATGTASPFSFSWNTKAVTNGSYTLTAKAYDAAGNMGQSAAVTVNVSNAKLTGPRNLRVQVK